MKTTRLLVLLQSFAVAALLIGCEPAATGRASEDISDAGPAVSADALAAPEIPKEPPVPQMPRDKARPYFTGSHPESLIENGSFSDYDYNNTFPDGWTGWVQDPLVRYGEDKLRFDLRSVKLTGHTEKHANFRTTTAPSITELRGKTVTFGGWIYTATPDKVAVQIIDNGFEKYYGAQPTKANEWQLVTVTAKIAEDSEGAVFTFTLKENDPPVTAYIDGAALIEN